MSNNAQTKVNVPLLKATLAYIKTHPEEWNQAVWVCGTTACFAGRALLLAGAKFDNARTITNRLELGIPEFETRYSESASVVLGIDEATAGKNLFFHCRTIEALTSAVRKIIAKAESA